MYTPRSPRSVYYRALRRVQRRADAYVHNAPNGSLSFGGHCGHCQRRALLLAEAVRLTNRLADL